MRLATTAIAVLLLTALPASAFGDEIVAEMGASTAYYTHPSFDAVSAYNAQTEFTLTGGWQFDDLGGLRLLGAANFTGADVFRFDGDLSGTWSRQRLMALAEYGVDVFSWFRPFARGGLGYAHQFLEIDSIHPRLKDHAHDLALQGALGLEFALPFRWGSVGLNSQFGYQYQTPATFDEMRHDRKAFEDEYSPGEDPWTREEADFGSLRTDGLYWTIGATVRFKL